MAPYLFLKTSQGSCLKQISTCLHTNIPLSNFTRKQNNFILAEVESEGFPPAHISVSGMSGGQIGKTTVASLIAVLNKTTT